MEKVLVTGADGFIGRNLVKKLLSENKEVFGIVYPGHNIYENDENENLHIKCMDLNQVMNHVRDSLAYYEVLLIFWYKRICNFGRI